MCYIFIGASSLDFVAAAGLIPYIANKLICTDASKNPNTFGPYIRMSCATKDPYRSQDIEFNQITNDVEKGSAAVDLSFITVRMTAKGEALNTTDRIHPNIPM